MLDGKELFPEGFHPSQPSFTPDAEKNTPTLHRSDVKSYKYRFIDFGLSTRFESNEEPRRVIGVVAAIDIPELSLRVPYDPFAVDIYAMGTVYRDLFDVRETIF